MGLKIRTLFNQAGIVSQIAVPAFLMADTTRYPASTPEACSLQWTSGRVRCQINGVFPEILEEAN